MSSIQTHIDTIQNGVYGKDVRSAIVHSFTEIDNTSEQVSKTNRLFLKSLPRGTVDGFRVLCTNAALFQMQSIKINASDTPITNSALIIHVIDKNNDTNRSEVSVKIPASVTFRQYDNGNADYISIVNGGVYYHSFSDNRESVVTIGQIVLPDLYNDETYVWVTDADNKDHYIEVEYIKDITSLVNDIESLIHNGAFVFNDETNSYENYSIENWFRRNRSGIIVGVRHQKNGVPTLEKLGAIADLPDATPGTLLTPAVDPYRSLSGTIYKYLEANYVHDASGIGRITAIKGDSNFKTDGSNGDVVCIYDKLYYRFEDHNDYYDEYWSDSYHIGFELLEECFLPDGTERPYIPRAKYAMSQKSDGSYTSASHAKVTTRSVSHNGYISQLNTATSGLCGKTTYDDAFIQMMLMTKYGTTNSQNVFGGCTSYSKITYTKVAENGTNRVIIPKADADYLVVGSAMQLGTHADTTSEDRNTGVNYNIFDKEVITKIETYEKDSSLKAVYFENASSFNVGVGYILITTVWQTGACDDVQGDGSPYNNKSSKEPFVIQGIETSLGVYEINGNVMTNYVDGSCDIYVVPDSKNAATSLTSNYKKIFSYPLDTEGWKYRKYPGKYTYGLATGNEFGASTSTGVCDGLYMLKNGTTGQREWPSLGGMRNGSHAGLWYVDLGSGLGNAWWYFGGRLSYNGRVKG